MKKLVLLCTVVLMMCLTAVCRAGLRKFARQLRAMGVDEALRKKGAESGDTF